MNSWINLTAVAQILVAGLILGAGVPALFALGLRAMTIPGRSTATANATAGAEPGGETEGESGLTVGRNPVGMALAVLCFAIVLAAIAYGIHFIVTGGH